jgi:hypothetical protein
MLLPALEAGLVERMRPDGRTCLVRVGRTLGQVIRQLADPVLNSWPLVLLGLFSSRFNPVSAAESAVGPDCVKTRTRGE